MPNTKPQMLYNAKNDTNGQIALRALRTLGDAGEQTSVCRQYKEAAAKCADREALLINTMKFVDLVETDETLPIEREPAPTLASLAVVPPVETTIEPAIHTA